MRDYVLTGQGEVPGDWIDENGHMNMMWYTHLVDLATRALLAKTGIDERDDDLTYVAGRISTAHRRELRFGDHWQSWSGLATIGPNAMTCLHRISSGTAIAARCEITVVPFDRQTRTVSKFTDAVVANGRELLIDGLTADRGR